MKLNKFTKLLLNLVLILLIALLLKSLITVPKNAYANETKEYLGIDNINFMGAREFADQCNKFAKEGWKLHSFTDRKAIFER
jgi:hypothetical protein